MQCGGEGMKKIEGDLLALARQGEFDVMIHGCNCMCRMGRGIALSIRKQFPQAYAVDLTTIKADKNKLGTYSSVEVNSEGHCFTIVNAYTQYNWQGTGVLADYAAIKTVFDSIKQNFSGKRIAYPKIGAGLAKGDWNTIEGIIVTALTGEDHTLVIYKQ